jgi:ubiquinone/menaquinone biosynthesis C-methylase UbiE
MSAAPQNPFSSAAPWNDVANGYTEYTRPMLALFAEPAIERAGLGPETRVIDVATGPGTVACLVAPHVASVHAVDFAQEMVARCRERVQALGLQNVHVEHGDGQALPYASDRFDVAFSMFGLMFFPNRVQGFQELCRVLRPGGRAFVTSWAPVDESPLMQVQFSALRAADPSRPAPQRDATTLENPELFAAEFIQGGFDDVTVERVFREIEIPTLDHLITALNEGSAPIKMLKKRLGPAEWERQSAVIRSHLAEALPSFPVRLGSTAWLASGTATAS